ncbi:hypothetical protein HNY73_010577 [Argiope bruennichi]|uniref:Uncharacterized protein n=1 Tax=Argiope bruennichi TaxID=94029 RepID=A0A8T0F1H5_ARGBR|nr:hypothetical protein HNY73_010577 [Argiope bruennichi]
MECQKIDIASVETNHLNGFSAVADPFSLKELSPVGPVVENLENKSDKETSVQSDIPTLLQVFKNVYDQRIASIENNADFDRNRKNEEKVTVLEQYIQHVLEQNDTFVSTMLELETEAQQRVKQMEKRLKSSAKTTMMSCVTFCEVTPEQVFGPVQSISNVYVSESPQSENDSAEGTKKGLSSDISSQENTDSNTSSPYMVHPVRAPLSNANSNCHSCSEGSCIELFERGKRIRFLESQLSELRHQLSMKEAECECHLWKLEMLMQHNKNRQIFPPDLPSSGTSLPKCISLPDIGNIYSFTNVVRKSYSYSTFGVAPPTNEPSQMERKNCDKPVCNDDDISETRRCNSTDKNSEHVPCVRKGQSEPHLFMFGDNIYVYRPCEPIKKASNIALHDDYEMSLPPCESIDLKFPTEESRTNVCDWATLNKTESFGAPQHSYYKDEDSSSSCTCSDPEIETLNKEMFAQFFGEKVSSSVQTDDKVTYSIGLQAAIKQDDNPNTFCSSSDPNINSIGRKAFEELLKSDASCVEMNNKPAVQSIGLQADISPVKVEDKIENGSYKMDVPKMMSAIQTLKESLTRAEDKAQAKEMLVTQLQEHLTSAVKEVELKDTALNNLEKKLDLSRQECASLRQQISDLNLEIHRVLKDLEDMQMMNDNLCLKLDAKEEKIQEILIEQKELQDQKRALLTRLDAQEDELENTKKELQTFKNKADSCSLQVEQQNQIIRNLQEALVQSKRAFDAVHQKAPLLHAVSNESKNSSRSSVMDI